MKTIFLFNSKLILKLNKEIIKKRKKNNLIFSIKIIFIFNPKINLFIK
jgi:hypothetical protein